MRAPIYTEQNHLPKSVVDLLQQAQVLLDDLNKECRATERILKANDTIGYGIDQSKKNATADLLITTIRSIKTTAKGW